MKKCLYIIAWITMLGCLTAWIAKDSMQAPAQEVYYREQAMVLLYHDVRSELPPGDKAASTVSTAQLREHLQMLTDKGFHILSMDDFVSFMLYGKPIPPNALLLTFYDGYESFYKEAAPVLQQFRATAANFIVGESSDRFNPKAEPHLSWAQMRRLKAQGMGFYNHTYHLHYMAASEPDGSPRPALASRIFLKTVNRAETEEQYRQRIYTDLAWMEKRLNQELGEQRFLLAFPYGAYNETVLEEARRAGIELFFGTEEGMNTPGNQIVKRVNAGEPYMSADTLWAHMQSIIAKEKAKH